MDAAGVEVGLGSHSAQGVLLRAPHLILHHAESGDIEVDIDDLDRPTIRRLESYIIAQI
jgi:hypothetical protein